MLNLKKINKSQIIPRSDVGSYGFQICFLHLGYPLHLVKPPYEGDDPILRESSLNLNKLYLRNYIIILTYYFLKS